MGVKKGDCGDDCKCEPTALVAKEPETNPFVNAWWRIKNFCTYWFWEKWQPSNLEKHAKSELEKAGFFDTGKDNLYDGMLGKAVLDLVKIFGKQGHSGMSAAITRQVFGILANWKVLSPLTNDPTEWNDITHKYGQDGKVTTYQSRRMPSAFSDDNLKTWYDIDTKDRERKPLKTPAEVKTEREKK